MDSLERLTEADAVARLAARDPSLFAADYDTRRHVAQRLGWTDLADKAPGRFALLDNLAAQVVEEGATDIVLLGMGGSSLAPLVLGASVPAREGSPRLHVLDTTCPRTVLDLFDSLDPSSTYLIVASKSGTTIEPLALYSIARAWLEETMDRPAAGRRCIVITDPGSPLEARRQKEVMRLTLSGVPNVGGRFSALTMFGLAPAALAGLDIHALVERARTMEDACGRAAEHNPGALLAAWLNDRFEEGRDKLTVVCSETVRAFGLWVEQLIAESTGKKNVGVVPILDAPPSSPSTYGEDRAVVVMRLAADGSAASWALSAQRSHPVFEIVLDDELDLGAEFVRWETATALLGHLMGIDPFDEPNVAEAKRATESILRGGGDVPHAAIDLDGVWATFAGSLAAPTAGGSLEAAARALISSLAPPDYLALLAYLPYDEALLAPLRSAWRAVSGATRNASCFELGPRYLHSTGQLHKGGPDTGAFLMLTARDRTDSLVPGEPYTLGGLFRAQAEGDLVTLAAHGKRVLRLDLPEPSPEAIGKVAGALSAAIA